MKKKAPVTRVGSPLVTLEAELSHKHSSCLSIGPRRPQPRNAMDSSPYLQPWQPLRWTPGLGSMGREQTVIVGLCLSPCDPHLGVLLTSPFIVTEHWGWAWVIGGSGTTGVPWLKSFPGRDANKLYPSSSGPSGTQRPSPTSSV